jgi:hypothetical protein
MFHSSKLKTERARSHINALAAEVSDFSLSSPCHLVIGGNDDPEFKVFELKKTSPIPENIYLIAGDAVHNLRSALDHLAYDLVRIEISKQGNKSQEKLLEHVQFPIAADSHRVNNAIKTNQIDKAGKMVENAVRALRPYRGGNYGLCALHDLDRIDKHRLIIPVIEVTATDYVSTYTDSSLDGGTATILIPAGEAIEFDKATSIIPSNSFVARGSFPRISVDVGLPMDPFKGIRVVDWLGEMANYLDGVTAAFESLLLGKTFTPPDPIIPITTKGLIVVGAVPSDSE